MVGSSAKLVLAEPIGEKGSRQIQIRLLPVELTIGVEQRNNQVEIFNGGAPDRHSHDWRDRLRGFLDFAVTNAGSAGSDAFAGAIDDCAH
jgi:hypothetical protein